MLDKVVNPDFFFFHAKTQFIFAFSNKALPKMTDAAEAKVGAVKHLKIQIPSFTVNPYLTNGFSHHFRLGESTFIFRGDRSDFYFLSHFSMKFLCANRIAPDGMPRSAASHLGLYCLPMSYKRDARLK